MNYDFSIEAAVNKIQNPNIKNYFDEVYQTYINGNYRSSTVMLYSVLICDLVYKMRDLRDIYNDDKALKILLEIEGMQAANPKSPEWEGKLIDLIKQRTNLLEPGDIVAIESLQKFRHLSAHPIITNADLLYHPNKETVQSLIRNILEGVLTNPPFFSNRIYGHFLDDLSDVKDKITEIDALESYLKARYLNRIKEGDFIKVFRSHWKIVFIADDAMSTRNRSVNLDALEILIKHNTSLTHDIIKGEPVFFSNISKKEPLSNLIFLISRFPAIYSNLEGSLHVLLEGLVESDDNYKLIAWYKKDNLKDHLVEIKTFELEGLKTKYIDFLCELAYENDCVKQLHKFLISYFTKSNSYDTAISRFKVAIRDYAHNFELAEVKIILRKANGNSQIYHAFNMPRMFSNIIREEWNDDIKKSDYPSLFR